MTELNAPSQPETPAPLTPERLTEIRSTLLGEWLAGGWRVRSVPSPDGGPDQSEVYLPGSAAVIATFPDWADSVAVFLADAHEAVPELLAEAERLTAEMAKYVGHEPTVTEEALYAHGEKVRAGVLREAADAVRVLPTPDDCGEMDSYDGAWESGQDAAVAELRRMADDTKTPSI